MQDQQKTVSEAMAACVEEIDLKVWPVLNLLRCVPLLRDQPDARCAEIIDQITDLAAAMVAEIAQVTEITLHNRDMARTNATEDPVA